MSLYNRNPFVNPKSMEDTICNASHGVSMVRQVLDRGDTDPVNLNFCQWYGLVLSLQGIEDALSHALCAIQDVPTSAPKVKGGKPDAKPLRLQPAQRGSLPTSIRAYLWFGGLIDNLEGARGKCWPRVPNRSHLGNSFSNPD